MKQISYSASSLKIPDVVKYAMHAFCWSKDSRDCRLEAIDIGDMLLMLAQDLD
jgi:hypothetical protein